MEDVPDEDDFFSSNASVRNETRPVQATTTHNNSDDVESTEDGLSASCLILMVWLAHNVSERMMKDWNTPIYAFFEPLPKVIVKDGCRAHKFMCFARGCKAKVRHFLDTKDCHLTSNLHKHAKSCWGEEVIKAADDARNANEVRTKIVPNYL